MNKRVLALFLCCALVLGMVPVALSAAFSTGSDFTICDSSGAPADSITLPQNDKTTLTAVAETDAGHYQWQIRVSDSVWANIAGSTETTLELSYAMVASLLKENSVDIRCRLTNDVNNVTYSNIVAVTVEAAPLRAAAKRAPAFGSVISGAEPIGEPVISEASDFVQSSPAAAPAAQNEEAPAAEPETDDGSTNEELPAPAPAPAPTTYSIVINYIYENGNTAAPSWTATVATGTTYKQDVKSPSVLGYTPDWDIVTVDASEETTIYVTYKAAEVNYTVKHLQQNVENDEYTLVDTETKQGLTETAVGEGLAKKNYEGFYSLLYDTTTTIAADGSTNVDVYYDRYYYLMSFDLDGGYGVEPIYARYGAPISVSTPTKAGYTFAGWDKTIPETMPVDGKTFTAQWTPGTSGFTVVFWYENADDEGYSVAGSYKPANVAPGTVKTSGDYKDQSFDGRDDTHFTYNAAKSENVTVSGDGSTVLNVYFTRNTYTLKFTNGTERVLTCGKEPHTHTYTDSSWVGYPDWYHYKGGCYPSGSYSNTPICGKEEHTHRNSCYSNQPKVVKTITTKYDADISGEFTKAPFSTTYNGRAWKCTESNKFNYALQTLDRMPGFDATFNLYDKSSENKKTIYYYVQKVGTTVNANQWPSNANNFDLLKQVDTYFNFATYNEEYHEIQGFTRYSAEVAGFDGNEKDFSNNKLNLYYMRNSYTLKFYNHDGYVANADKTVQYEAPLSSYNFTPDYPAGLEPNAYVFDGWYTTAGCYDGSEANLNEMTMPASDVILYAKWTPKFHTVKTYLTKDAMDTSEDPLKTWDKVPHGTVVTNPPEDPERDPYTFVGWFYISDTGTEKAFDFSMPVNRDLSLYAKWRSDVMVQYTIRYKLENSTEIAAPIISSALAGTTKTFDAKTGKELNEGYQSGYFPKTASHSLTFNIEGGNEYTFVYVAKEEVNYTVRYLEKDTNKVLHEEKHAATRDAVITEKFEQIQGYAPDAYQKRLVLSADEENNIITFWYVKDELHAPVQIIHWMQNTVGDGYTEYSSSTNLNGEIGKKQTSTDITIAGCQYTRGTAVAGETPYYFTAPDTPEADLGTEGLVLNLYYDRIEYPYEFRFLEQGTGKKLAEPATGNARYGAQVIQEAKDIPGYKPDYDQKNLTIGIEDPTDEAKNNVKTFYYVEDTVNITYQVVGPTGSGTLNNYQDNNVGVIKGTVTGATPTPADGFKFVGWYKDEACTQPVETTWVGENNKLTPQKTKDYGSGSMGYEAATYYAKFETDVADLTITKSGWDSIDENQSFLFEVTGPGITGTMRVAINRNGSVTISGLKIGTYTVTEVTNWSWRYTNDSATQTITLQPTGNTVSFENSRENGKWLGGDAYAQNKFTKN